MAALTAAAVGLRKDGHGRGKRVQAQLERGSFQQYSGRLHWQGWQWVGLGPRRIKRVGSSQPGYADLPLRLSVEGLQIGIADRPVRKSCPADRAPVAAFPKINFVKAPVVPGKVNRAAADPPAVFHGGGERRFVLFSLTKGVGLELMVVREHLLPNVWRTPVVSRVQLVMAAEIGILEIRALLQYDDL